MPIAAAHHILVVDDEPDIEMLVTQKFRRKIRLGEYRFTFAQNGMDAYQQIMQLSEDKDAEIPRVDMVLTDINMPVMDGIALLSKLDKLDNPPKTVVISAYSDMANIRAAMNKGAFDFVTKPINMQDLEITVERTLAAVDALNADRERFRQAQVQLVQSEKMSSLGQMVAGIAHEVNNPVNFIYGNLGHAQNYVDDLIDLVSLYQNCYPEPLPEIKELIEDINLEFLKEDVEQLMSSLKMGATRIKELVVSLKNFSRLDEAERKYVDIHEGIESTLTILNSRIKGCSKPSKQACKRPLVKIERVFGELPLVDCHPSQLNQVVMNVVCNALDAFETNPWSSADRVDEIKICTEVFDDCWVRIAIADNGPGMEAGTIEKLFDPFFTTKPVGKGTGLGMAISYQIVVEKHKGRLACQSVLGEGTQFTIEIPFTPLSVTSLSTMF